MTQSGYVYIDVEEITGGTDKAFCMRCEGKEIWIPKSQMADPDDYERGDKDLTDVAITEWIATEKGLN